MSRKWLVGQILVPAVTVISILVVTESKKNEINFQREVGGAFISVDSTEMLNLL